MSAKVVCCISVFVTPPSLVTATQYYIDNAATGSNDGSSWANAWQSFLAFRNRAVTFGPGDVISISGGSVSKTYQEQLYLRDIHGSAASPVTIRVAQEEGHDGTVVITDSQEFGIYLSKSSYFKLTGKVGADPTPRIKVTGNRLTGVVVNANETNQVHDFEISHLEITGNVITDEQLPNNYRQSNGLSVALAYVGDYNGDIHHLLIHDNACQVEVSLGNGITDPTQFGVVRFHHNEIFDFHGDGMQVQGCGVDIYNNKIRDIGEYMPPAHPDGIQFFGRFHRIFNNQFYNMINPMGEALANAYIRYNPYGPVVGDVYIYNNLFTETRAVLFDHLFRGIELSPTAQDDVTSCQNIGVFNNTFSGIPVFSLFLGFSSSSVLGTQDVANINIVNNLFIDTGTLANANILLLGSGDGTVTFGSDGDAVDVVIDYNCFFASSSEYSSRFTLDGVVYYSYEDFRTATLCQDHDPGTIVEPLILKPPGVSEYDASFFVPARTSVLRGAGKDLRPLFVTDIVGATRPVGSGWTIGAYEAGVIFVDGFESGDTLAWSGRTAAQ